MTTTPTCSRTTTSTTSKTTTRTKTTTELVALGLGGNAGDTRAALRQALDALGGHFRAFRVARLYRTRALSAIPQPAYYNTAAVGFTTLPPDGILSLAKALEQQAGRQPTDRRDAPRPLDIDLLLHGERLSDQPELRLPHPRLSDREFALRPLADLIADHPVPGLDATVSELLARLPDQGVRAVSWSPSSHDHPL